MSAPNANTDVGMVTSPTSDAEQAADEADAPARHDANGVHKTDRPEIVTEGLQTDEEPEIDLHAHPRARRTNPRANAVMSPQD
jgi:hypothetical protein